MPVLKEEKEPKKMPRTIWVRDFYLGAAQAFIEDLWRFYDEDPAAPVLVMVASYGGPVDGLLPMIAAIEQAPMEIRTCCIGAAMSAGAVLLSSGAKGQRYILKYSRVMIHEVSGFSFGNISDIENEVEEARRMNELVMGILAENCGVSLDDLISELRGEDGAREHYFDPAGAVAFGMADKVIESTELFSIVPSDSIQSNQVAEGEEENEPAPPAVPEVDQNA